MLDRAWQQTMFYVYLKSDTMGSDLCHLNLKIVWLSPWGPENDFQMLDLLWQMTLFDVYLFSDTAHDPFHIVRNLKLLDTFQLAKWFLT